MCSGPRAAANSCAAVNSCASSDCRQHLGSLGYVGGRNKFFSLIFNALAMDIARLLNPEASSPHSRISVSGMLNQEDEVDALPLINELATFSASENRLLVPLEIQKHLNAALAYLHTSSHSALRVPPPRILLSHDRMMDKRLTETSVKINRQTTLDILYHYPLGSVLEYPETHCSPGFIGHLFRIDP